MRKQSIQLWSCSYIIGAKWRVHGVFRTCSVAYTTGSMSMCVHIYTCICGEKLLQNIVNFLLSHCAPLYGEAKQ